MLRRNFSHRLFLLFASALLVMSNAAAQPAPAEQRDENAYPQEKFANLSIKVDSAGSAVVILGMSFTAPSQSAVEAKLNEALGFSLEKFQIKGYEDFQEEPGDDSGGVGGFFGRND